jgi:hypothetical protein
MVFSAIYINGTFPSIGIYIKLNIDEGHRDGTVMETPPPPMMRGYGMSRTQMVVVAAVGLGLLLLAAGTVVVNLGKNPGALNAGLVTTYGPIIMDIGLWLLVGGIILAAVVLDNLDVFVRLFLLILAFVALLLVIANPSAFFP